MSSWLKLLERPADRGEAATDAWFTRIAERLLNGCRLIIAGAAYRFTEVELYYFAPPEHADPFTHKDPLQLQPGRWYFHRTGGVYRSGSFKGVDLTFGDGQAYGGVLIRGIEGPGGTFIDGPSLTVDHLLDATGADDVAALDRAIGEKLAWDAGNPLRLEEGAAGEPRPLRRSARVGITLRRSRKTNPEPQRYVMAPYRFLTDPRRTAKGKPLIVIGLHLQGVASEEIRQLTGCTRQAVERYLADFEAGRKEASLDPFFGKELGPKELCRLYGAWSALHGAGAKGPGSGGKA
jgi:hypothetical protein